MVIAQSVSSIRVESVLSDLRDPIDVRLVFELLVVLLVELSLFGRDVCRLRCEVYEC